VQALRAPLVSPGQPTLQPQTQHKLTKTKPTQTKENVVRVTGPNGYWASDDPGLIDVDRVHEWMSQESYWAQGRTREVMARAIDHSLSLGLYAPDGTQAGYARLVTDWATFAWLCDVFVDTAHRGQGLGSFLVAQAVGHPDVADIRQVLMAEPGRTIYRRLGYGDLRSPERWMERPGG
jgi:GNAT superfamily N-acetyltransferase